MGRVARPPAVTLSPHARYGAAGGASADVGGRPVLRVMEARVAASAP